MLNALAAVRAAQSVKDANGAGTTVGNSLLFGSSQLAATGAPGSAQSFTETVTNLGTTDADPDQRTRDHCPQWSATRWAASC